MCRLATEYAILDEQDLAVIEADEIIDSWPRWVSAEVRSVLRRRSRAVFDAVGDEEATALWWATVHRTGAWAGHDGRAVRWNLDRLVPAYAARLIAEARRRSTPERENSVNR